MADLLRLGFATIKGSSLFMEDSQLACILNIDEACLSLDGSQGKRGGRPTSIIDNPNLNSTGKKVTKSSATATMITGSNVLGEAIPPFPIFNEGNNVQTISFLNKNVRIYAPDIW